MMYDSKTKPKSPYWQHALAAVLQCLINKLDRLWARPTPGQEHNQAANIRGAQDKQQENNKKKRNYLFFPTKYLYVIKYV